MVKRIVVGAHYGLNDWLVQRVTGALIAIYTVVFMSLLVSPPASYTAWKGLFTHGWVRIGTLMVVGALAWHAWVGMRGVLMDYVKRTAARLFLEVIVILVLAAYVGWAIQILWR